MLRGQAAFRSERLPSSIGPRERQALTSASSRSPWPGFASKIPHPVRPRDSSPTFSSKSSCASRQLARSDPKGSLRSLQRTGPQARRVDVCSPPIRCFQRRASASRWLPVASRAYARFSPVEQLVHGEPPRSRRVGLPARGIVLPRARSSRPNLSDAPSPPWLPGLPAFFPERSNPFSSRAHEALAKCPESGRLPPTGPRRVSPDERPPTRDQCSSR